VKADGSLISEGLGGPYFDPSYGLTYSDSSYFELTAIDGYAVRDIGIFPDDGSKWKVLNIHYFGPQSKMVFAF
jgi:hypothetical protein